MRLFVLLLVISCNAENYYGLPIGSISNEQFGLFVDVFVADPHTVVILGNRKSVDASGFNDITLKLCKNNFTAPDRSYTQSGYIITDEMNTCISLVQSDFVLSQRWKRDLHNSTENVLAYQQMNSSYENNMNESQSTFSLEAKVHDNQLLTNESVGLRNMKKLKYRAKKYKIKRRNQSRPFSDSTQLKTKVGSKMTKVTTSSSVLISPLQDEVVALLLSHEATIQEYSWLGIYSEKSFHPLLSVENIEPPREEIVGNWTVNNGITASVVILNCNTILVQNIVILDKTHAQISFYGGVGENYNEIQDRLHCSVLGYTGPVDLRIVGGLDLLVLLPDGMRTFDIDYFSVFEHDTKTVIAVIEIPSLLVPPCD